jgi:hypothetical protein
LIKGHGYSEEGLLAMMPWEFEIITLLAIENAKK